MLECVPISGRRGRFLSGKVTYSRGRFELTDTEAAKDALIRVHERTETDDVIGILDVDSFSHGTFNPDIIKDVRMRGRRLWLITYIRNEDDVIDAMCSTFDRILIPIHTINGPHVLVEADHLSEHATPVLFIDGDVEVSTGRPYLSIIDELTSLGHLDQALFDVHACSMERVGASLETAEINDDTKSLTGDM